MDIKAVQRSTRQNEPIFVQVGREARTAALTGQWRCTLPNIPANRFIELTTTLTEEKMEYRIANELPENVEDPLNVVALPEWRLHFANNVLTVLWGINRAQL